MFAVGAIAVLVFVFWRPQGLQEATLGIVGIATPTPAPARDTDGDGISDFQETYWKTDAGNPDTDNDGFSDGEEVLSGHDPAKEGPDDLLNKKRNVTERAGALLLSGMATGALKPGDPEYDAALQELVDSVFKQFEENATLEDTDKLTVTGDELPDITQYAFRMSRSIQTMFAAIPAGYGAVLIPMRELKVDELASLAKDNPQLHAAFTGSIDVEMATINEYIKELLGIPVPPSMSSSHRTLIRYLRAVEQQYGMLRAIDKDPLQGLLAMQVLNELAYGVPPVLMSDFSEFLRKAINP